MAIILNANPSTLGLKFQAGTNSSGAPTFKTVNFGNIKAATTDQDVYDIAVALTGLQTRSLDAVVRTNSGQLLDM